MTQTRKKGRAPLHTPVFLDADNTPKNHLLAKTFVRKPFQL